MADQPQETPPADADGQRKRAAVSGDPVKTADKQPNPIDVAEKKVADASKGLKARSQAPQEGVGSMDEAERDRLVKISEMADASVARREQLLAAEAHYKAKRELYGEDTADLDDETERLRVLNAAALEAFRQAQERASQWIAPEPVAGAMKPGDVSIVLGTPVRDRKHSMHIRVVGEVENGFVRLYDTKLKDDIKQGRVGESPQFGTKNKIRVVETDDKGNATKVETRPGYLDWGPIRLNPGEYEVSVEGWGGEILAADRFKIEPDADGDGASDQDPEDLPVELRGEKGADPLRKIAAMADQQFARQQTKAETGEVLPAPKAPKA